MSATPAGLTWRRLWDDTAAQVGSRAEARWLCEEASGAFGGEFGDVLDEPATDRMLAHLDAMLGRYAVGEPLQYVLGRWAFRTLDLMVDRRVLIPRPETEVVAGVALAELARRSEPGRYGPARVFCSRNRSECETRAGCAAFQKSPGRFRRRLQGGAS